MCIRDRVWTGITGYISFCLTNDELNLYACNTVNIDHFTRPDTASAFTFFSTVTINGLSPSVMLGVSVGVNEMYVGVAPQIMRLTSTSPDTYNYLETLNFPSPFLAGPGQLSKDGLSFFCS